MADINRDFIKPYFIIKEMPYNLQNVCALPSANFRYYGINSALFTACLLWNLLPLLVKQSQSLVKSKSKMKTIKTLSVLAQYAGHGFVVM